MNDFTWHPIKSLFQSTNTKNNFLFLALNFSLSVLRTSKASMVHLPGISSFYILSKSINSSKHSSKTFSHSLKAYFTNFIPLLDFGLRGLSFPLKIGTNKLNIHSPCNILLVTHNSEEESHIDVSTVKYQQHHKVRCASNDYCWWN